MGHLVIIESPLTGAGPRLIETALGEGHFVTLFSARVSFFLENIVHPRFDAILQDVFCDTLVQRISAVKRPDMPFSIVTVFDRAVARAAKMAEIFEVETLSSDVLERATSKVEQREILVRNGLPQANRKIVFSIDELEIVLPDLHFPLVIKPEYGYGSAGVRLCSSPEDARSHFLTLHSMSDTSVDVVSLGATLLDEYLEGPEFGVEIFDDQCIGVVVKHVAKNHHDFIEEGYLCDAKLPNFLLDILKNSALSATRALSIYHGPCHVDVKLTKDGPYVIEVNPRVAGSLISNLVADVYGFDLVKALLYKSFNQSLSGARVSSIVCSSAVLFVHDWDLRGNLLPPNFELLNDIYSVQFRRQDIPSRCRSGMLSGATRGNDDIWNLLQSVRRLLIESRCEETFNANSISEVFGDLLNRQTTRDLTV